jgi:dipeptidyl aminopeptidase/acylaminoacyl peptidase
MRTDAPGIQPPSDVVELTTLASHAPPKQLRHGSDVLCAAFSPSGSILAVGGKNGEITIWSVAALRQTATLRRHIGMVYAVAFSPDGRRLASGGNDGSLRLWDTATWDQVFERHDHSSYVHDVAFSPDGSQIATASGDWTLRVWDSRPKSERLTQVCVEAEVRRRMRPLLEALLTECGDIKSTAARIRGDASLTFDERRAALRALLALSTDQEDDGILGAAAQR